MYRNDRAVEYLNRLDEAHVRLDHVRNKVGWNMLSYCYSNCIYEKKYELDYPSNEDVEEAQKECLRIISELSGQTWELEEYRQEILLAAEGVLLMAELFGKLAGYEMEKTADVEQWLMKYRIKWLQKNKESELYRIEEMFRVLDRA